MRLTLAKIFGVVALLCLASPASAELVTIGSLIFQSDIAHFQGFEIVNETGRDNGCDFADGIPVCDALNFHDTSLTITLSDNTTIVRAPTAGFSFAPIPGFGSYLYGDGTHPGDDLAQSFLFDPSLSITSAIFSGTVSPGSFLVTDGTNESTFIFNGTFSTTLSTLDVTDGLSTSADITIDIQNPNAAPEPTFVVMLALLLLTLFSLRYRGYSRKKGA